VGLRSALGIGSGFAVALTFRQHPSPSGRQAERGIRSIFVITALLAPVGVYRVGAQSKGGPVNPGAHLDDAVGPVTLLNEEHAGFEFARQRHRGVVREQEALTLAVGEIEPYPTIPRFAERGDAVATAMIVAKRQILMRNVHA
jgi:hypothetical protein